MPLALFVAIDRIERWFSTGWLSTNSNSIQIKPYSWFNQSQFRPISLRPFITVGVDTITPSEKARNIGVTFDTHLTLSYHVNDVVKKAFYHLRNIAKIRKYISAETTEIVIHCFVTSKLDFCNALLYGLPKYQINKLQNVQNAAARIIARLRKYDHISQTLKDLHRLPVEQRIVFKINLITHKVLNGTAPHYLQELLNHFNLHVNNFTAVKQLWFGNEMTYWELLIIIVVLCCHF